MTRCTMENTACMHIGKNYKNDFAEKILSCMDMILNPSCGWQAKILKLELNWKINNLWSLRLKFAKHIQVMLREDAGKIEVARLAYLTRF